MSKPERFVVAVGNILDGHDIYGPFTEPDDADAFCQQYLTSSDEWWLIRCHEPPTTIDGKFDINEWINVNRPAPRKHLVDCNLIEKNPSLECKDGFKMSVQASCTHYCSPKRNEGPWHSFEVMCQGSSDPELGYLMRNSEDTVIGWVPEAVINSVVNRHGGPV